MNSVGQEFWKGLAVLFPLGTSYVIALRCYMGAGLQVALCANRVVR